MPFQVLGIGTLWANNGVYPVQNGDYIGSVALEEYKTEFQQPDAPAVPVEEDGGPGTAHGHWVCVEILSLS